MLLFNLYFFGSFILKCNCLLQLPLEDIFIITKNNATKLTRIQQLKPRLLTHPSLFIYNSISVFSLQEIRTNSLRTGNYSLIFYYFLDTLEDFDSIFEEISVHRTNLSYRRFKFIIRLYLYGGQEIDVYQFRMILLSKIQNLDFYQENPIFLQIITDKEEYCLIGYRIDNIGGTSVVKQIFRQPAKKNCIWETIEGLIDSKISNDFDGAKLIVSAVDEKISDYDVKVIHVDGEPVFESGFAVDVLLGMQFILNFTIVPVVTENWGIRSRDPNYPEIPDKWGGAVGDTIAGKVDLVISSTANAGERAKVVDFNFATHTFSVDAFFMKICGYRNQLFPLLSPFHLNMWIAIVIWIAVNLAAYKLLKKFLCRECQAGEKDEDFQKGVGSWGFSPICLQGTPDSPMHYTLRTLYYFQLIVSVILNAAYSGTLVSFVSVTRNPITKLEDLLNERYGFKFGMDPVFKAFVGQSDTINYNSTAVEMFDQSIVIADNDHPFPLEKLLSERFVFMIDNIIGYREMNKGDLEDPYRICWIGHIPVFRSKQFQGSFVKKNSRLRRSIGFSVLKMLETGNVKRWKKLHLAAEPQCDDKFQYFYPSRLGEANFAILVLSAGVLLSLFVLLSEYCIHIEKQYDE